MSLDIRVTNRRNVVCPHCGKIIGTEDVCAADSGGRGWYPILEEIGYYVPYEERTEENDWYGKDMVLTAEQMTQFYEFVKVHFELYNACDIRCLIAAAILDGNMVVVNADW